MGVVRPRTATRSVPLIEPRRLTLNAPAGYIDIPLTRAEYYPPESEVGDEEIGILDTDVSVIEVSHHVHDVGIVTIGARGARDGEVLSFEFDMTSAQARRLSVLLAEAADGADLP
jgi:hypothetical protein